MREKRERSAGGSERVARERARRTTRSRRGGTDWTRVDATTDAEIAAQITSDADTAPELEDDWLRSAETGPAPTKQAISLRVDPDVLEWFKQQGAGYQTRMNDVLRRYVDHQRRASRRAVRERSGAWDVAPAGTAVARPDADSSREDGMPRETGKKAASKASKTLTSRSTAKTSKSAAGSALSQRKAPARDTSKPAAKAASKTLRDGRTSAASKSAAGSALSQRRGK